MNGTTKMVRHSHYTHTQYIFRHIRHLFFSAAVSLRYENDDCMNGMSGDKFCVIRVCMRRIRWSWNELIFHDFEVKYRWISRTQIARRNESLCRRSFWVNWFCFACCSFRYCAWMSCAAMESANQFLSNLILFLMCEGRKIANARLRSDVKRYCLFYESVARYAYLMA